MIEDQLFPKDDNKWYSQLTSFTLPVDFPDEQRHERLDEQLQAGRVRCFHQQGSHDFEAAQSLKFSFSAHKLAIGYFSRVVY